MRPWQHAFASRSRDASGNESDWQSFLPVHEMMDFSKTGCADRRHRIMLHHCDMGSVIVERAFPERDDCSTIVRHHVTEDMGFEANLSDWLAGVSFDRLPRPVLRRVAEGPDSVSDLVVNRMIGARHLDPETRQFQQQAAQAVARFLWMPLDFDSGAPMPVLSVLMNSVGPSLVRRVFGPPQVCTGRGMTLAVDYGWIAEAVIMACFGRIPDLIEVVRCVDAEPRREARIS